MPLQWWELMAIIIPSKNIYDKQNPKVRDNVIERIEVGAVEVVPDNSYETPVFNQGIENGWIEKDIIDNAEQGQYNAIGIYNVYQRCVSYLSLKPIYLELPIKIIRTKYKSYINKIYTDYKNKGTKLPQIGVTIRAIKQEGIATASARYDFVQDDNGTGAKLTTTPTLTQVGESIDVNSIENPLLSYEIKGVNGLSSAKAQLNYTIQEGVVSDIKINEEDFSFDLKLLVGYQQIKMGWDTQWASYLPNEDTVQLNGDYVNYIPQKVEITIYGDTIGIDLTDKTVHINGDTQKKVHSVDGNELMQTTNFSYNYIQLKENSDFLISYNDERTIAVVEIINNYYQYKPLKINIVDDDNSAEITKYYNNPSSIVLNVEYGYRIRNLTVYASPEIKKLEDNFTPIIIGFEKGKETATIRCSIGNYYDYDSGNKVISVDNSTQKMSFALYDKVIPMVYGADGQDRPMSTYKNGTAKVFQVLGSKVFYDGAVWQELYLQEVDK